MATDKQIAASRANGARSRGPITPEGRLRCSLLAQAVVLEGESRPLFSQILRSMQDELQPQGVIENMMVQRMAVAQWRQLRAWGMEKATIAHDARNAGKHDRVTGHALAFRGANNRIHESETRLDLHFTRAWEIFEKCRANRQPPQGPQISLKTKDDSEA